MRNTPEMHTLLQQKFKYSLTNLVYIYLLTAFPLLLFVGSFLSLKVADRIEPWYLFFWCEAVFLVFIGETILTVWLQKKIQHSRLLIANVAIIGLMWGIAAMIFMPANNLGQFYLIFTVAVIAVCGMLFFMRYWLLSAIFLTATLVPLAGSLLHFYLQHHSLIYFNLFLGSLCYWIFLLTMSYYGCNLYAQNAVQQLQIKVLNDQRAASEARKLRKRSSYQASMKVDVDTPEVLKIKFAQSRAHAKRHNQGLAIFSIALTNLAVIKNDFGQDVSDLLMKTVIIRLQECKREADILAQTAENKFILVLSEVLFGSEIRAVSNRIFKILAENVLIDDANLQVKLDLGVSLFPHDGNELPELLQKSDRALQYLANRNESLRYRLQIYDQEVMQEKEDQQEFSK